MSKSNGYLGKKDILEADDIKEDSLEVPEWGGKVRVRGLSGQERAEFAENNITVDENGEQQVVEKDSLEMLVALTVVDETGERLFSPNDVKQLRRKSAKALGRVAEKARELSGLDEEFLEDAKKNSE